MSNKTGGCILAIRHVLSTKFPCSSQAKLDTRAMHGHYKINDLWWRKLPREVASSLFTSVGPMWHVLDKVGHTICRMRWGGRLASPSPSSCRGLNLYYVSYPNVMSVSMSTSAYKESSRSHTIDRSSFYFTFFPLSFLFRGFIFWFQYVRYFWPRLTFPSQKVCSIK